MRLIRLLRIYYKAKKHLLFYNSWYIITSASKFFYSSGGGREMSNHDSRIARFENGYDIVAAAFAI